MYINDLPNVSKLLSTILFADDFKVFLTGNNDSELINTINVELCKLVNWLPINKLSLNLNKPHYIVSHSRKKDGYKWPSY